MLTNDGESKPGTKLQKAEMSKKPLFPGANLAKTTKHFAFNEW